MPLLEGYLWGLALVVLVGPVFFTLLQATLQYGFKSGFAVAFGIFVSDIVCVLLCTFGGASFFQNTSNKFYIGLLGAIILVGFGISYAFKSHVHYTNTIKLKAADYLGFFSKGFVVNFVNPFVFVVWIGIIGNATGNHGFNSNLAFFLSGVLLGILTTDTAKAVFAHKLKVFLQPAWLIRLYRIIGVCLIGCGIGMFYMVVDWEIFFKWAVCF